MEATAYHEMVCQLINRGVRHGWAEGRWTIETLKDGKVKVTIISGESFVFFLRKEIKFDETII